MRRTLKASLFIGLAALGCFLLVKLIWFGPDSEVFPEFDFSQGEAVFQELEQKIFTGAWKAEEYSETDGFFKTNQGRALLHFSYRLVSVTHEVEPREDTGEQPAEPFNIDDGNYTHKLVRKNYVPLVSLQETKFVDDRSIRLNPSDSKYDNHSLVLQLEDSMTNALLLDQMQAVHHRYFRSNISVRFMLTSEVAQHMSVGNLETKITTLKKISAAELSIVFTFEQQSVDILSKKLTAVFRLEPDHMATQKLLFLVASLAVGLLNMYAIQNTIEVVGSDRNQAFGFSNYIVIVMTGMDVYYCFIYVVLGIIMGVGYYKFAACVAFIYFMQFCLFDLRLFHQITRACLEQAGINDDARTFKRRVCVYNVKHYTCLFVSFAIIMKFPLSKMALYLFAVLPVFQVINNMACGLAYLPEQFDLMFALLLKSFLFAYLNGYQDNILEISTKPLQVLLILGWFVLMWYVVERQYRDGGDFLLPPKFRPERYNYLCPLTSLTDDEEFGAVADESEHNLCAICMTHLSVQHEEDPEASEAPVFKHMERAFNRVKHCAGTHFMRTPCGHDFHIGCLLSWMKVKMECPSCRRELPNLS